jgi:hypothetical protein
MSSTPDARAPLAEPPFDESVEELDENSPSVHVAAVLATAAEMHFDYADYLELALASISQAAGELTDELDAEEIGADPVIVAALERLQIGSQILAELDLGEDDDDEAGEEVGEEGYSVAA